MNQRHLLLGSALLLAAALVFLGSPTTGELAEPLARRPALRAVHAPAAALRAEAAALALAPRPELFGAQGADALFGSRDFTPPPGPAAAPAKPSAPVAPPMPFAYLGKMLADGRWEVYLSRAGQSYAVRERAQIDDIYRVDRIAPPVLTITYLPLNQVQQLNIGSE